MRQAYVGTQVIKRFARFLTFAFVGPLYTIHALMWVVVLIIIVNDIAGDPMGVSRF